MHSKSLRYLYLLTVLAILCLVAISAAASWSLKHAEAEEAGRLIPWTLGDATAWRRVAAKSRRSLEDTEIEAGSDAYRRALALNPLDSQAWEGLAALAPRMRDEESEHHALRSWVAAIPHSPKASWALANLLVRQGRVAEALPFFKR